MDSTSKKTPIISVSDFKSIEMQCKLTNTTTQIPFRAEPAVRLIQFVGDRGMMLEAPDRCCSIGHAIMIELSAEPPDAQQVTFKATARVDFCNPTHGGIEQIQVTLLQFDEKQWNQLTQVFTSRQSAIDQFLNAAKGQ